MSTCVGLILCELDDKTKRERTCYRTTEGGRVQIPDRQQGSRKQGPGNESRWMIVGTILMKGGWVRSHTIQYWGRMRSLPCAEDE
eukprot:6199867-Pleurochrysis_carterae.AAC.4